MSFKQIARIGLPLLVLAAGALFILNAARPGQETAARQQAVLAVAPGASRTSQYPPQPEQYAPISPVTVNMLDVPVGVYAYRIDVRDAFTQERWILHGHVTLVR